MRVVRAGSGRGRLPSYGLPIGGLDGFKVFCLGVVIDFLDGSVEDDEGVADKDVGDVLGEEGVDSGGAELGVFVFVYGDGYVVVDVEDSVVHVVFFA